MLKKTLLRGGCVVTMDDVLGELEQADVLLEGSRIAAVAPRLDDVTADETIDATDMIVTPGMIDTHIHLWQTAVRGVASGTWGMEYFGVVHPLSARFRPEDMYASTYGGAVELLTHGVTTALDFCHSVNSPEYGEASLDALTDAGIRGIFGYGFRDRPEVASKAFSSLDDRIRDAERLFAQRHGSAGGRIRLAIAMNNPDHLDAATQAKEVGAARSLGVPATVHSNLAGQVTEAHERGLLGPDILWVHCGSISDAELRLLSDHGGALIASPEAEAGLMAITPVVGRAVRHGVPVGLGIDVPSAMNADLITQLRVTYALDRLVDSIVERFQGRAPARSAASPILDARRLLEMATLGAARILGLDDEIGSITPGKQADLTVFSTAPFGLGGGDPVSHVVFQASAGSIDSVFVAGEQRVCGGRLIGVDQAVMRDRLDTTRDYLLGRAPGVEWPELTPAARALYEATQGTPVV